MSCFGVCADVETEPSGGSLIEISPVAEFELTLAALHLCLPWAIFHDKQCLWAPEVGLPAT